MQYLKVENQLEIGKLCKTLYNNKKILQVSERKTYKIHYTLFIEIRNFLCLNPKIRKRGSNELRNNNSIISRLVPTSSFDFISSYMAKP